VNEKTADFEIVVANITAVVANITAVLPQVWLSAHGSEIKWNW